jgi:hypothetical protein
MIDSITSFGLGATIRAPEVLVSAVARSEGLIAHLRDMFPFESDPANFGGSAPIAGDAVHASRTARVEKLADLASTLMQTHPEPSNPESHGMPVNPSKDEAYSRLEEHCRWLETQLAALSSSVDLLGPDRSRLELVSSATVSRASPSASKSLAHRIASTQTDKTHMLHASTNTEDAHKVSLRSTPMQTDNVSITSVSEATYLTHRIKDLETANAILLREKKDLEQRYAVVRGLRMAIAQHIYPYRLHETTTRLNIASKDADKDRNRKVWLAVNFAFIFVFKHMTAG